MFYPPSFVHDLSFKAIVQKLLHMLEHWLYLCLNLLGIKTVVNKDDIVDGILLCIYVCMFVYVFSCRWVCMSTYTRMDLGLLLVEGSRDILEIWIVLSSATYYNFCSLHIWFNISSYLSIHLIKMFLILVPGFLISHFCVKNRERA